MIETTSMGPRKETDVIINKAKCVGVKDIVTCLFDWNTARFLLFVFPLLTYTIHSEQYFLGLAIYVAFLLFCDLFYYKFSIAIFDPELVISRGYNLSAFFNDTLHGAGLDYGFNFYDGDYTKTRHQAQIDKFEYAYKQLKLEEGMSLLDCGCGCGDWMYWLQTKKNIKVVGVNITPQQVEEGRKRGLRVICSNWKTLDLEKEGLVGQFDAVSFWDSVEHFVNAKDRHNLAKKSSVYQAMYDMAQKMLKPKSKSGRVWISCLHMNFKVSKLPLAKKIPKAYQSYILDKYHSGCYPKADSDELVTNASLKGLKLVHRKDTTRDYYDTSVMEPSHFGKHIFSWTPLRVVLATMNLFLDPNAVQRVLWYSTSNWMFQFNEDDIKKSDVTHWWLVFERN